MTLLRLLDEPEAMTKTQLQELLADDEVRENYELLADCKKVYQREKLRAATPLPHGRGRGWVFSYRKIAAIFLAAVCLGGLAWASIRILAPLSSPEGDTLPGQLGIEAPSGAVGGASPIRFSDIRLDSILSVVAAHYGKTVCYRSEKPRTMKLITTWNPEDSLAVFLRHLNMFDYLHLTLLDDTIFVESKEEDE